MHYITHGLQCTQWNFGVVKLGTTFCISEGRVLGKMIAVNFAKSTQYIGHLSWVFAISKTNRTLSVGRWILFFSFPLLDQNVRLVSQPTSWRREKEEQKKRVLQVPPRFELGSLDSESRVLTITPWDRDLSGMSWYQLQILLVCSLRRQKQEILDRWKLEQEKKKGSSAGLVRDLNPGPLAP